MLKLRCSAFATAPAWYWVDDQCLFQFRCCPGVATEDQYTLLVLSRCDKLFRYQIHAIVETGH